MAYTLDVFIKDAKSVLKDHEGPAGREKVRVLLEKLLANEAFVDEAVGPDAPLGTRKLYEDKDLGFVVLAHVNAKGHKSPPHDHGSSWAVYGQAIKYTDMSVYKRLDGGNAFGNEVSVISGGLACIAGAAILAWRMSGFRRVEVSATTAQEAETAAALSP